MTEVVTLIWNDPKTNKNRFYEVSLMGDSVSVRFGRVGEPGRTIPQGPIGRQGFDRLIAGKMKKGYKKIELASNINQGKQEVLRTAATKKLVSDATDPRLTALIDRLLKVNAHEILTASGGQLKVVDGQIATPLGLLTNSNIQKAYEILSRIEKNPRQRLTLLGEYMTLVPQAVGRRRTWIDTFLATTESINEQESFLQQLKQSLEFSSQQKAITEGTDDAIENLFRYRIQPVDDEEILKKVKAAFAATRNSYHGQRLYNSRVKNIYTFTDSQADDIFSAQAATLGNVIEGWHGTRAMNLLSIASKGLKNPREEKGLATTGSMFGRGIYSSVCSTKALGYSDSGVWGGSRSDTHYLFNVSVCLGETYVAGKSKPATKDWDSLLAGKAFGGKVFNSITVEPGFQYIKNPETIVPNGKQLAIRYLLELTS